MTELFSLLEGETGKPVVRSGNRKEAIFEQIKLMQRTFRNAQLKRELYTHLKFLKSKNGLNRVRKMIPQKVRRVATQWNKCQFIKTLPLVRTIDFTEDGKHTQMDFMKC